MELDIQKLQTRFAEVREHLEHVRSITELPDEELFKDARNLAALKYHLIVVLEAVGSVCVHVCAKHLQKAVSEYADCFDHLREGMLISKELGEELIKMVRFRNRLVHQYWNIDDKKVVEYARKDLHTIDAFLKEIGKLIQI